ncbi:MAG: response regulator [Chitinophagaceae bacterium]
MNRISIVVLALFLFFLGLFYWSVWWLIAGIAGGIVLAAYRLHQIRIDKIAVEKEELELQLEEKNDQLEAIKDRERRTRQQADRANQTKTTILAKISHEIRTPLNGMMGMAALMAETGLNTEQKEYTQTIRSCGESLLSVINEILIADILEFSKVDSLKNGLEEKDFDLHNCIEEVIDMFSVKAAAAGLELMYEIDTVIPRQINGDSLRLRQVLLNLLSNALAFTHRGEIIIRVLPEKTSSTEKKDEFDLRFEICDTGIGIEEDKLRKILQGLRYTGDSLISNQGENGLGLTICEKLVGFMGGHIEIESRIGMGTTVRFSIKTRAGTQLHRSDTDLAIAAAAGKKIMVVDNNSSSLAILKNILENWKLVPVLINSGQQALNLLAGSGKPDLIITDMHMPGMDGIELARTIKAKYPEIPIILLSPPGNEYLKKQDTLFNAIIPKPVKRHTLGENIINQFKKNGRSATEDKAGSQQLRSDFSAAYPLRILIAEDDLFNQQLAIKILNKLGYEPQIASNGKEVLEIVSNNQYDLILMDVQMPEMDGLEATRMIRLCLTTQPIIIAMTANAMQGDREECLQAGMDDYLSKPVELQELVRILERWAVPAKEKAPVI